MTMDFSPPPPPTPFYIEVYYTMLDVNEYLCFVSTEEEKWTLLRVIHFNNTHLLRHCVHKLHMLYMQCIICQHP